MTLPRPLTLALVACVLSLPVAAAHQEIPEPLTGTVEVAPGDVASVRIDSFHGRDVLNFRYVVMSEGGAVAADVLWTDAAGRDAAAEGSSASRDAEFRFEAAPELAGAAVVIRNPGDAPATVRYEYLTSAPFWRSPNLWVPAVIPFVLLAGSLLLARALAPWMHRRGAGPVRPPGWQEAQATKHATHPNQPTTKPRTSKETTE